MPYISREARNLLSDLVKNIENTSIANAGELNYLITILISQYISLKGNSYQTYNDCLGVLEGSKLELYRRVVAPYEDFKKFENGDVYKQRKQ